MARELYQGDFAQLLTGAAAPNTPFTLWTDQTAGTQVTDVVAADGVTAYTLSTNASGLLLPFRGPDGYQGLLFADTGVGQNRYPLIPVTVWPQFLSILSFGAATTWDAVSGKPTTFPPSSHSHPASQVSDSTLIGQALMTAATAQAARSTIGAGTGNGTSDLQLGTTATTAAAGNHSHAATGVTFSPAGSITATTVQAAIEQAALTGGGGGSSSTYVWKYASGGYPALPSSRPAGVLVVQAFGPVQPSSVPTWLGYGTSQALLEYTYAALT